MKIIAVVFAVLAVLGHCHVPAVHVLLALGAAELTAVAVLCLLIRRAARWRMRSCFA